MARSAERVMDDDGERRKLQEWIMRYRLMEREVTDPLARGLMHDLVADLEAARLIRIEWAGASTRP